MIKKLTLTSIAFFALVFFSFAQRGRVYVADNFSGIQYSVPVNLYITISSKYEVKVEGVTEDIDWLIVEKNGADLKIRTKRGSHRFDKNTRIYVSMPALENISLAGSGSITTEGIVKGRNLSLDLAGSGSVHLDAVNVENIAASISGSGNIEVDSKSAAVNAVLKIAGSGSINVNKIQAKNAEISIAGSGDVSAYASENCSIKVAGSGNVECFGNPKNSEKMKYGSGTITIK